MDDGEDEFGADAAFLTALATADVVPRVQQPTPQRIQPPQRLDHPPHTTTTGSRIVQPTPQVIASKSTGSSSIFVSPRQKGNPILTNLRSFAWEYSDIPADYVLGLTTCALFLSLKYHRLHPEYIYNRIKGLQGKYQLRILLTIVDIGNHEDSLRELAKTSLVNNVTIILCWSAAEAARYLELYKSYEHANPNAIRGTESKGYTEKMVEFITMPRSVNKTDAVSLVSAFGSIRAAMNARPEEIAVVGGWGERKVKKWCSVVDEPFRVRKATRKKATQNGEVEGVLDRALPLSRVPLRDMASLREKEKPVDQPFHLWDPANDDDDDDDEAALRAALVEEEEKQARTNRRERDRKNEELSGGIAAALAKLRENG